MAKKLNTSMLKTSAKPTSDLDWLSKKTQYIPKGIKLSELQYVEPGRLANNALNLVFNKLSEEEFDYLKNDIEKRGMLVPIIAKSDGILLAGHNRLAVAIELRLERVPVQYVREVLTQEQEKEFLFKDNVVRRQLTPNEKMKIIEELFGDEIDIDNRGGDRRSAEAQIKSSAELLIPLPQKVEQITGIPEGTAKRILAKIRRDKSKELQQTVETELVDIRGKDVEEIIAKIDKKFKPIMNYIKKIDDSEKEIALKEIRRQLRMIKDVLQV
jgi:ParB-like chromosome segregation protein Spo0J